MLDYFVTGSLTLSVLTHNLIYPSSRRIIRNGSVSRVRREFQDSVDSGHFTELGRIVSTEN